MNEAWNIAHKEIEAAQERQRKQYDKRANTTAEQFAVGDLVFVHTPHANKAGITRKLQHLYHGPQRIVELNDTNAVVRMCHKPRGGTQRVHLNRCKRANKQTTQPLSVEAEEDNEAEPQASALALHQKHDETGENDSDGDATLSEEQRQ